MTSQRIELGPTPAVTVGPVRGDAEVRGGDYDTVTIDADCPDSSFAQTETALGIGPCQGDCTLRLPDGGAVACESVGSDMRVKGVYGGVDVGQIGGDFAARHCGRLATGPIGGDADIRDLEGGLSLEAVQGSVAVQDCQGIVHIGTVGGDCAARDVQAGLVIDTVGGDLDVQTGIAPGAVFQAQVGGDIRFRLSPDASVCFSVPASSDLQLDSGLKAAHEGDLLIVTVGSGEASAELSAGGTLRIGFDDGQLNNQHQSILDHEFDSYLTEISAEIDTHLRGLEQHLNDLPERVRHQVKRNIHAARRNVESAERQARKVADPTDGAPRQQVSRAGAEQVTEGERLAILKMLEDGKIGVEDAQKLLAALEGEG